jgi:hypothetical protein
VRAVNLIPADQRRGAGGVAGRSGGGAYMVLALLGGLALLALLYGLAHRQISNRRAQVTSLNARTQQAQAAAGQLASYTNFIALREERERAVSVLVDSRFDWAHAFHELGRVLPAGASISSINGAVAAGSGSTGAAGSPTGAGSGATGAAGSPTTASGTGASKSSAGGATAVSATPPGSVPTFTLTGCARSQSEVALTLNRLRLIDGVGEVTLQSSAKSSSGAAASGSSSCPPSDPAFTILLTFDPLPAASSIKAATAVPASTGGSR